MKIIKERGGLRRAWDIFILLAILVSVFLIPYQLVFLREVDVVSSVVIYILDAFFIVDILFNLNTSFWYSGKEITDVKRIRNKYLESDFWYHLIASFPIDIFFLLIPQMELLGISMVLWLRLPRLLRFRQFFKILNRWRDGHWINPGYLKIVKFIGIMLFLIHLISCGFFISSFIANYPPESWVIIQGIASSDVGTQYIRSLYWTVTTMTTVGYGDITPHYNYEYLFSIIVMFMGASSYAYIIGNIASMISTLDIQKANYWSKMDAVSLYLRYRGVPSKLNERVKNFYEYRWVNHRGLDEDVIFNDLPDPLKLEVIKELTQDLLKNIPLFKYSSENLKNILLLSLKAKTFDPGSYIVHSGEVSKEIIFISKGNVEILNQESEEIFCTMSDGEYFGDLSIVLGEKRNVGVRTTDFCETFILHADDFYRIKNEFKEFMGVIKKMSAEKSEKASNLILDGVII